MVNKRVREKLRGVELWGGAFPYNTMLSSPLGLTYLGSEVDNFGIQCFSLSLKMNVVISSSFKAQESIIQLDSNLPYLAKKNCISTVFSYSEENKKRFHLCLAPLSGRGLVELIRP